MKSKFSFLLLPVIFLLFSGQVVTRTYTRIVSLAPSVTEVIYALGGEDLLVADTTYCDWPPAAKSKPKVGGFSEHNVEAIVLQKPDLVIVTENRGAKITYEKLNQLGIKTAVASFYDLKDLMQSFELIGRLTGKVEEAEKIRSEFNVTIDQIKKSSLNRPRKKVAFVMWRSPLIVPTKATIESDAIHLAGSENMISESNARYPKINIESFFERDPDIIIDASSHGENVDFNAHKKSVREFWSQYSQLHAVQNQNVYVMKKGVYTVPGPRTIQFMKAIDALLDPSGDKINQYYEKIEF